MPVEWWGYQIPEVGLVPYDTCLAESCWGPDYTNWIPIFAGVASATFLGISLLYMLGRLFAKREWEALARAELIYAVNGVIAVACIVLPLVQFGCAATCKIAKGDPYNIALKYISRLKEGMEGSIVELLDRAKDARRLSVLQLALSPFGPVRGASLLPYAGCGVLADIFERVVWMFPIFVGSLVVQELALIVIPQIAITVALPIGFILRIVPSLRTAGAFLIALSLGLYFVFPLTYVFAHAASRIGQKEFILKKPPKIGAQCYELRPVIGVLYGIGKFLPQVVFFPTLSTIVTIAFVRCASKVFMHDLIEMR